MNLLAQTLPLKPLGPTALRPGVRGDAARPLAPPNPFELSAGVRIKPAVDTQTQVQQEAQRFIAQAFYGTLLRQMHDSAFKSDLWSGGRGGQAFSSLYDQHLIDRIARSSAPRLARTLARKLQAKKAYERAQSEIPAGKPVESAGAPENPGDALAGRRAAGPSARTPASLKAVD